jgi:hypothetical protein
MLLDVRSIEFPPANGPAGSHLAGMIEQLGIAEAVRPKLVIKTSWPMVRPSLPTMTSLKRQWPSSNFYLRRTRRTSGRPPDSNSSAPLMN